MLFTIHSLLERPQPRSKCIYVLDVILHTASIDDNYGSVFFCSISHSYKVRVDVILHIIDADL